MSRISESIPHPTQKYRQLRLEAENVHEFVSLRQEAEARIPDYFKAPTEAEAITNLKRDLGATDDPVETETAVASQPDPAVSDAKAAFLKGLKGDK